MDRTEDDGKAGVVLAAGVDAMCVQRGKRRYAAPHLVRFGALRDLTQAGAGSKTESGNPGNCSQDPNRKPCTPSDRTVKENIVRIGTHPLGIGLYLFDYKPEFREQCGHGRRFGVMADEVETVVPEAVCEHPAGYRMVDYTMLGIVQAGS